MNDTSKEPLQTYWSKPLSELVEIEHSKITEGQAERHRILSLLAMSLVCDAFNGNKRGARGNYPGRSRQLDQSGAYCGDKFGDRYLGHNIACLAVDERGEIIDFEFNHNELYNSSAEHAEARLVRRIFNLNRIFDNWQTSDPSKVIDIPYATVLSGVTLYTTLESCAQCSGIMALGNVKRVVYLQSDPTQYRIGSIMYNLSNPLSISHPYSETAAEAPTKYGAPEPVGGELFCFDLKRKLESAYAAFVTGCSTSPFWTSPEGIADKSTSITSFLCTDAARDVFRLAAEELSQFEVRFPEFTDSSTDTTNLTNSEVLDQAIRFRHFAATVGRRATPHR